MNINSIFEQYNTYVYNFALKLSCHPTLAEDLTQETFIKAWKNLSSLNDPHAIKSWLRKIYLNEFLMYNRKSKPSTMLSIDDLSLLEKDGEMFNTVSPPTPEEEVIVAAWLG